MRRAGCYVPGGRAAYPSTVLMTALPATAAGVDQVVLCVPPDPNGRVADVTLAAAVVAGVDEMYAVGGAQAIAAMAYGTESIGAVDVIVGPGNVYVAIAKQLVAGIVGVPAAFAGPSEVVVVADGTGPAEYAAIDLIVQAEHGPRRTGLARHLGSRRRQCSGSRSSRIAVGGCSPGRHRRHVQPQRPHRAGGRTARRRRGCQLHCPRAPASDDRGAGGGHRQSSKRRGHFPWFTGSGIYRRTTLPVPPTCCPPTALLASPVP